MEVSKEAYVCKNIDTHEDCLESDHRDQKITMEGVYYGEQSIEENLEELPTLDDQINVVFEEEYPMRLENVIVEELINEAQKELEE